MLVYLAKRISSFFISKGVVKEDAQEIYDYCFEILLSTILNFCTIIFLSIITNSFIETICFIIGFMIVRSTAGGYHADTHIACWLILVCSYMLYMITTKIFPNQLLLIIAVIFDFISVIIIETLSPVEDHNKPFTEVEYKLFKKRSRWAVLVINIVTLALLGLGNIKWGFSVVAGMFVVSLSLIAGTLKNRKNPCSE